MEVAAKSELSAKSYARSAIGRSIEQDVYHLMLSELVFKRFRFFKVHLSCLLNDNVTQLRWNFTDCAVLDTVKTPVAEF